MARGEVRALTAPPAGPTPAPAWRTARVGAVRPASATARTLVLRVADWPGHAAGQHLDVRLTAPDGYQAARSYSIASAALPPGPADVEIAVERLEDGEVSPFLVEDVVVGDVLEVTGPLGGWFVWRPETVPGPVQLVGGGSGVVPLLSIVRTHAALAHPDPLRLLVSARSPRAALHDAELLDLAGRSPAFDLTRLWTREAPAGSTRPAGRLGPADVAAAVLPAAAGPTCYVCGPTPFVEHVAELLLDAGHDAGRIRTERFGGASPS